MELPAPIDDGQETGIVVWAGGVQVIGPLLVIPGRGLDDGAQGLADARQHALAVLAAEEWIREGNHVDKPPECGSLMSYMPTSRPGDTP